MAEKIFVNVALSNAENCVCCDEDGNTVECCIVGSEFGGMYHPDGIDAACIWAAEHIDLMRKLSNQVSECCAGKCQASTEDLSASVDATELGCPSVATGSSESLDSFATSSLREEPNDTDTNNEERTIIVDVPTDGTVVTIGGDGVVQSEEAGDQTVVIEVPEGVVSKSGNLSDTVAAESGDQALRDAGLPDSCLDELMGAGLDTPEKVLAFGDLSSIKGIGAKTRDKILRILNEGE